MKAAFFSETRQPIAPYGIISIIYVTAMETSTITVRNVTQGLSIGQIIRNDFTTENK
jgi:hypothetical protein